MIQGSIYRIMIGCPSDITEEVNIAKRIILKWSCTNAEAHQMVLLPLHWSDNSYPGVGQHPQKMLDRQLVDKSDMLVCIFGSKIGTATDTSDSGSIEEIEEHIKTGKHVMIFFKQQGDLLHADLAQIKKLQDFRTRIQNKAMWCEYEDAGQFGELFSDKLTLFLNDNWLKQQPIATSSVQRSQLELSEEETLIFSRWANDKYNTPYMAIQLRGGLQISLAYRFGVTLQSKQDKAWWEDFMERLMSYGYINHDTPDNHGHPRYKITKQGYDFAQTLPLYDETNNKIGYPASQK